MDLEMTLQLAFNGDGQNQTNLTYQSADFTVTELTPEPATMGLMLGSLLGLVGIGKRLRAGKRA